MIQNNLTGYYGKVFYAESKQTQKQYALKWLKNNKQPSTCLEIKTMLKLSLVL